MKVLIIKPDHLGDFALALPALWEAQSFLGSPDNLHVIVWQPNAEWKKILPWLPNLHPVQHPKYERTTRGIDVARSVWDGIKAASGLSVHGFDWGVEMTSSAHDQHGKIWMRAAGCRCSRGLNDKFRFLLNEKTSQGEGHQILRMAMRFPEQWGISGKTPPQVFMPHKYRWSQESLSDPVLLAPWAGTTAKQWPLERWAELLRVLHKQGRTARLLVTEDTRVQGERLAKMASADAGVLLHSSSIGETLSHLKNSALVVATDTGVAHFAWLVGTPLVQLFSGTADPARWGAIGASAILHHPPSCAVCRLESCPRPAHDCMLAITVDEVLGAIQR